MELDPDPLAGSAYRTIAKLTGGAMGEIVEAEHVPLRRRVIVKIIHARYAGDSAFVDRFRLEAQALAALAPKTAHIVTVLDVGATAEGHPFLVMEKLDGRTLKQELAARGWLPIEEAIGVTLQLLDALRCAHEAGIVHRDVKPENLFLAQVERAGRRERVAKLIDFGIAKVLPGAYAEDAPAPIAEPTQEGSTLGTPRYLAPEQARGAPVDARADLYSVGVVLYVMIAGRDPFADARGLAAILRAQMFIDPEPPSRFASQRVPSWLDAAILKLLAKDREARFASADEFAAALRVGIENDASARSSLTAVTAYGTEVMPVGAFRGIGPRASKAAGASAENVAAPLGPTAPIEVAAFSVNAPTQPNRQEPTTVSSSARTIVKSNPASLASPRSWVPFAILALALGVATGLLGWLALAAR